MNVSVYNGGGQSDYLYGLISGLSSTPVNSIEILDINLAAPLFDKFSNVKFYDVYTYQGKNSTLISKAANILRFYFLQAWHLVTSTRGIIHFQWLDRYYFADRVILPFIARLFGHRVILTVHNVNALKRDNHDSYYNRITLSIVYHLSSHLIVHTEKSKAELISSFKIRPDKISVIKHGMNNKVQLRGISQSEARKELGIDMDSKVVLFFGNIDYYKGLDLLIDSMHFLKFPLRDKIIFLIAGNYKSGEYINNIREQLQRTESNSQIISHIQYIQDEDIERYFMASDCIALPYREIYQSGVLFMAYTFGLPALATRVGNFENDIIEGKTGYLIENISPESVAESIENYFQSQLFQSLEESRKFIKEWSSEQFSWEKIGDETYRLYKKLITHE